MKYIINFVFQALKVIEFLFGLLKLEMKLLSVLGSLWSLTSLILINY